LDTYQESSLWKNSFESEQAAKHQVAVGTLTASFKASRKNVAALVGEIAVDLPTYTVHSIEHLDALWEIASQITGEEYEINPIEGYILGCSFLLHDAGMTLAAYPKGLEEIKSTREWRRIAARAATDRTDEASDSQILEIFLREQHAKQAERLPFLEWASEEGARHLIDDGDLRQRFGDFIGVVSGSHWWNHEQIEKLLAHKVIPAPAPFPSSWSVDLLKLACILRTADAAQIDDRRAPSFLRALRRNRLSSYSARHWTFQSRLTQAQNREDTLFFASFRPFGRDEAASWWLAYDTLRMIDGELRNVDNLISRQRSNQVRFASRRVANAESSEAMQLSIPTSGWKPVDTAFSISDIPKLVENLGGAQLYGNDPTSAVREIVQNAIDATRMRRLVDPQPPTVGVKIILSSTSERATLEVHDNGVGLSEEDMVGKLLSFGESGWLRDSSIGEYNDLFPSDDAVTGKYGIGFFSVFMVADHVLVKSRRFDASPDNTIVLEFENGLNGRPLLYASKDSERMTSGGTSIFIRFRSAEIVSELLAERRSFRGRHKFGQELQQSLASFIGRLFPAIDIALEVDDGERSVVVDGRNWITEAQDDLLERVEGHLLTYGDSEPTTQLTLIKEKDGTIVGRAGLWPAGSTLAGLEGRRISGAVVTGGTLACNGVFRGLMLGRSARASRDDAILSASSDALADWASGQAKLLVALGYSGQDQIALAEQVVTFGGNLGTLKFCEIGGMAVNVEELERILAERDEIWVVHDAAVSIREPRRAPASRSDQSISVGAGWPALLDSPSSSFRSFSRTPELFTLALEAVGRAFSLPPTLVTEVRRVEAGQHVYEAEAPIWSTAEGGVVTARGSYLRRGMTMEDLLAFKIGRAH
jgi:hypothetical protein